MNDAQLEYTSGGKGDVCPQIHQDLLYGTRHHDYALEITPPTSGRRVERNPGLTQYCREIVQACSESKWEGAEDLAVRIEGMIDSLEYQFKGRSLAAYTLGKTISRWDRLGVLTEGPIPDLEEVLVETCKRLVGDHGLADEVRVIVKEYNASNSISAVHLPHRAYNRIRRRLLREGMT